MTQLPDKLSDLIELAIADLNKARADSRYQIDMDCWHEVGENKCSICLAGSVMAYSLGADHLENMAPGEFGEHNSAGLYAIEAVRCGYIWQALDDLGQKADMGDRDVPEYDPANPQPFIDAMFSIAADLRERGL